MSDYRRIKTPGGTYFFTVITHLRRPILTSEVIRQALREGIQRARQTLPLKIEAWVLLPDHLHAVWTLPPEDNNSGARWAIIKRQVSRRYNNYWDGLPKLSDSQRKRRESGVWQRRFWEHQIRDDLDFQRHMDYLHWNPVKHGYVRNVADWPFSSFHRLAAAGIYPVNWGSDPVDETEIINFGE